MSLHTFMSPISLFIRNSHVPGAYLYYIVSKQMRIMHHVTVTITLMLQEGKSELM